MKKHTSPSASISRREALGLTATAVAAGATTLAGLTGRADAAKGAAVTKGRINQSVVFWCFNAAGDEWSLDKTCEVTKELGGKSVELVDPDGWATLTPRIFPV